MESAVLLEVFGYIGSALVVCSMLMASVVKLRLINMIGSIISGTYAVLCGALPLFVMNAALIVINAYNLYKLVKNKQVYDLVDSTVNDASVGYFLDRYKRDIRIYFPDFEVNRSDLDRVYIIYCEATLAGILLGKYKGEGIVDVMIDYTTPVYRDCSAAAFLYSKLPSRGVNILEFSRKETRSHVEFMTKMGFVKENGSYVKKLNEN